MKQPPRPAYWQLDLFVLLMIGLLVLVMLAQLSSEWETVADIAWAALTIAGMAIWVRLNLAALRHEERMKHLVTTPCAARRMNPPARTVPLTPVQERFLAVMERAGGAPCAREAQDLLRRDGGRGQDLCDDRGGP